MKLSKFSQVCEKITSVIAKDGTEFRDDRFDKREVYIE